MVKRLFFLFLLFPIILFSGEFTATVNRNRVNLGEGFTLNLALKNTTSKGTPFLDPLKKSFVINSQQQSYSTFINNGQVASSTTWIIGLIPQAEGQLTIPSISIETSEGILTSQPIVIQVVKPTVSQNQPEGNDISISAEVSQGKPYKNEPIIYSIKLISKGNLANIKHDKIAMDDAIVETIGEPKIYEKVVGGVNVGIIEYSYLITPLKEGSLKIPSALVQGGIAIKKKPHLRSMFDDSFDSMSMLQLFDQLKPFALMTQEIDLEVRPPVPGVSPWLPAKSLKIEEIWDSTQAAKVDEPLTRSFKIVAEGVRSIQLPSLQDQQVNENQFKVYADKPDINEEMKDGVVRSSRNEQYTLIPKQSGELTLPEISVTWWDVIKNEKAVALIPSRTLQVMPAVEKVKVDSDLSETNSLPSSQPMISQTDPWLYALIGGLAALLLFAVIFVISLQKKIMRLTEPVNAIKKVELPKPPTKPIVKQVPKVKSEAKSKVEKLPDLNPT